MKSPIRYYLIFILMGVILNFCKKDEDKSSINSFDGDPPLTDDQVALLDSAPDTLIHAEDIIMSTGQNVIEFLETYDPGFINSIHQKNLRKSGTLTPRLQKETFLARMFLWGEYLVDDANHIHPAEGTDGPAQNGLGYGRGLKDYDIRMAPTDGDEQCKTTKLYGLDCSGMMWVMTQSAKLPPIVPRKDFRVETISDPKKWTDAFKASADFKDLKMEDKGQIPEGEMKNGDIILWGSHSGIYLYGYFYQSNGSGYLPKCQNNLSKDRGPQLLSLAYILSWEDLGKYKVYRINSGNDYTMTADLPIKGYSSSGICELGDYKEGAVINFTVKDEGIILNFINNTDPEVTFSSKLDCNCLAMSFSNKSMITFTDFSANMLSISGYMAFNLTYTFNSSTDKFQCGDAPPITWDGLISTGIAIQDTILLPKEGEAPKEYPFTIWGEGTLKVARDDQ